MPIQCPYCHSFDIKEHYQMHIGYHLPENRGRPANWTTRKFRTQQNVQPDAVLILINGPMDDTWHSCNMCGVEFDDCGKIYQNGTHYI